MRLSFRPSAIDAALAAALLLASVTEALATQTTRPPAAHALVGAVVAGALAWRRRFPLPVLAVAVIGVIVLDPMNQLSTFAALVIAAYTTGAHLDPPRAWLGLALAVAPFWLGFAVLGGAPSDFVAPAVLYGGPWVVGRLSRERGRRVDELADRAARLEREQAEQRTAAVAAERARIARELHDIVSHSISVIAVQTQAVRRRLNPAQTREADDLRAVETTARQAMAEMRRLFGVLRADGERPSLAPQPGLDQLEPLLADTRAAGLTVDLRVEGDRVPLPPGVDLAAYRIVQEALTNARKHADTGCASVTLRFAEGQLKLAIEDDGKAVSEKADGRGYGLVGMRERVTVYGGTLEAGPRPEGGFAVRSTSGDSSTSRQRYRMATSGKGYLSGGKTCAKAVRDASR